MVRRTRLSRDRGSQCCLPRCGMDIAQWAVFGFVIVLLLGTAGNTTAQQVQGRLSPVGQSATTPSDASPRFAYRMRARRFLAGRGGMANPAVALDRARRQHLENLAQPRIASLSAPWQAVGPSQIASISYGTVTGRITSIAIDPADASGNTLYVGTTGGGVWKSTNAAGAVASVTFTPLTDILPVFNANAGTVVIPSLSIGALSVGQGVILAGTGDPNDATDSYYGTGILRSADAGLTWTLIQESQDGAAGTHRFFGLGFAGIAWSSATQGLVVAAVSDSAEGILVNAPDQTESVQGLYYSTDAGVTWQMATIMDGNQAIQTPLITGGGANSLGNAATAVVWNPVRQLFYAAVRFHGYYQSADGETWTRMTSQPGTGLTVSACPPNPNSAGSPGCPIFRGALAVQPVSGDMFAFSVDANNLDQGIWRDVCGLTGSNCASSQATFATQLNSTPLEQGGGTTTIAEGDYNLSLAAVASGTDTVLFAGTVDLYRCTLNGGCTFRNTTNIQNGCSAPAQVAPSQHALAAMATSGLPLLYLGNDGGLWRSTDGVDQQGSPCSTDDASHFENLNGALGSLAEVISFAQHPTDANTLLVGLGANGTAATAAAATNSVWPQLSQGEGGYVAIDPVTPTNWFLSSAAGVSIAACSKGAACAPSDFSGAPEVGPTQVADDVSVIDAPWILDPGLSSNVLIGTCRAWRGPANNGAVWTAANGLSTDFGGSTDAVCTDSSPLVRSLAAGGTVNTTGAVPNQGSTELYAGIAGSLDGGNSFAGHLFSTQAAGTASTATVWHDLATSPVTNDPSNSGNFNPGAFDISSVTVDSHDPTGQTVYATIMGFAQNGIDASHAYRSVDGGAHWLDINRNLPNAPANALVVDPNDANTVYVATDVGVYVTTQISTCATSNCWSPYGTGLPNAPVVGLAPEAQMPTGDNRFGELRVATYGRGIWQIPLLTAAAAPQAAMTLTPASLTFAAQAVGTASAAQAITVTNTGTSSLSVTNVSTTGDFTESDNCVGGTVAIGGSCTVEVEFIPTLTGVRTGLLTVYGNVAGGQATASLAGTGTPRAAIVLTPLSLVFGSTAIGSTSAAQNITVSNTGGANVSLQTPVVTGDFKISANTCGANLAPQVGCTVAIVFVPTASGTRSGSFSITDSSGTQMSSLSGTGTANATDTLAPLSLTFAAQPLSTASAIQAVTLTNNGDAALTLITASITSGDFTAVNGCGTSLIGHSSCAINVAFVPKHLGQDAGTLTVSDQLRSQVVTLNGMGVAPAGVSLSPASALTFGAMGVGLASTPQTVTLTNNGSAVLTIEGVAVAGDFGIATGGNSCGTTLGVGKACMVQVVFTPTVAGGRTGSLSVQDSAANSPQTISLGGTGVDFTLSANGSTSVTVSSGASAVYPLLLSSEAGVPGMAVLSCAGAPANSTCVVQPSSAPLGGTATISVTVQTGVSTASMTSGLPRCREEEMGRGILVVALPLGMFFWRSRARRWWLLSVMAVACLVFASGCGSGRRIPPATTGGGDSGGPPTASGTYTLTASASSAGLTRSVTLTLVVQ